MTLKLTFSQKARSGVNMLSKPKSKKM